MTIFTIDTENNISAFATDDAAAAASSTPFDLSPTRRNWRNCAKAGRRSAWWQRGTACRV